MTSPVVHEAKAQRRNDGWARWRAVCTCGWHTGWLTSGKEGAELAAAIHATGEAA